MSKCTFCNEAGKKRKFFLKDEMICDAHYVEYLEFLVTNMNEEVTDESMNDAFAHMDIRLKPEPPKQMPKPYDDEPWTMRMGI
jgi:hypothetical protein